MGMGRAAERIKILKCPTAASRPLKLGVTSRKNFHRRQEHTTDQNAECDVVESVRENVHDSRPIVPTLSRQARSDVTECRDRTPLPAALVR
jgi:hypothetical protein